MIGELEHTLDDFMLVAKIAHCPISREEIIHEQWLAPHKERAQPRGYKAVYVYSMSSGLVLKVGRVGENSGIRYQHDHYIVDTKGSTLSTSILKRSESWPILGIEALEKSTVADWLRTNTDRDNLLIPDSYSDFFVYLLEAFLHCRLNPLFEGRKNDKGRKQISKSESGRS